MIWFITFITFIIFCLILEDFIILGCMHPCQLWLKPWKRWKLLQILWNFPNLVTCSGGPFIPVCKVVSFISGEACNYVSLLCFSSPGLCFLLLLKEDDFSPFVWVYVMAHGSQGCMRVKGKFLRNCKSPQIASYLGQYIFLVLTKNNNFHFFLNCAFDLMFFFMVYKQ